MSKYYPIGTVVRLDLVEDVLFMIGGYLPKREDSKVCDYFAVPFPFGLTDDKQYICFNKESIKEVVYEGYCGEQCKTLLNGFNEMLKNFKNKVREISD